MKISSRAITVTLSAGLFTTLFVSQASAGCGDLTNWQGSFAFAQPSVESASAAPAAQPKIASARGSMAGASIVGLWKVQFVSMGNVSHNPSIPDGAIIDFGYNQWHSDGTEILNSGMHEPATQNFCLGVWGQTGFLTFEINHFALSYDATTQLLTNYVNIREQITLSPSGDDYTGTFTIDVYTPNGTHVDHLAGTITGSRLTVDSTLP
jgi:hypothetical protein